MTASTDSASDVLLVSRSDGRVDLRLNRPQQFNPLSEAMLAALGHELQQLDGDPSVRCVVISAAGKAFSAGHDLRQMQASRDLDYYRQLFGSCAEVMRLITELPVPVIARVQGVATAAGCQLVASCDLAVASDDARFAVSGINVGLFCSVPAVPLSRNIAQKRAFEMLVTGKFIDARTAQQWGLVNSAVPADALDAEVERLVAAIRSKSAAAIRHGKAAFYRQQEQPRSKAYALAAEVMAQNMMEEDTIEGLNAFFARRDPVWSS